MKQSKKKKSKIENKKDRETSSTMPTKQAKRNSEMFNFSPNNETNMVKFLKKKINS